ncbi:Germin-like protein [Forsythia ovata]|uniref:Germin-like protein n=1 Tax=Forsythia ovata TaxID=205694 RepID=A0ABD1S2R4_9LAMI
MASVLIAVFVNGKICKDPNMVSADDFFFPGLNKPGNTSNAQGSRVTPVNVNQLPGLNTLGISLTKQYPAMFSNSSEVKYLVEELTPLLGIYMHTLYKCPICSH